MVRESPYAFTKDKFGKGEDSSLSVALRLRLKRDDEKFRMEFLESLTYIDVQEMFCCSCFSSFLRLSLFE